MFLTSLSRKEKLWPHTREFADRAIAHASNMLKKLQEVGEPCSLYTVSCAATSPGCQTATVFADSHVYRSFSSLVHMASIYVPRCAPNQLQAKVQHVLNGL